MNRKQIGWLIVCLIIVGGAGLWVEKSRDRAESSGEIGAGQKLMGQTFPINDVVEIDIRQGTNQTELVKSNIWTVKEAGGYPASFSQISDLLIKLQDMKVVQSEEVEASQLGRFGLADAGSNAATTVEFKNGSGRIIQTLKLGKLHVAKANRNRNAFSDGEGGADGRYVINGTNSTGVLLVADPLSSLQPKPAEWLNKDFFKIERPKAIAVDYPGADSNSWKIVQSSENGDWVLAKTNANEKLDAARVSGVSSPFVDPSFSEVLPGTTPPAVSGLDHATNITVDTFDDFTYAIKVGAKTNDNYYVTLAVTNQAPKERPMTPGETATEKPKADAAWKMREEELSKKFARNDGFTNWVYLVPTWVIDPILKERKFLMVETKDAAKTPTDSPDTSAPKN